MRDNGGHAVALAWSMDNVYDVGPGEVFWAASDVGWVVGHSYIVYAPLLAGCTTVLYEGKPVGTPDAGGFWRVIADHKVKRCSPRRRRSARSRRRTRKASCAATRPVGVTVPVPGRRAAGPGDYRWAGELLGVPVIDHWWQTETGWPIVADPLGSSRCRAEPGRRPSRCPAGTCASSTPPAPGRGRARRRDRGELPLPPGCLPTLWNDDERFVESYLRRTPATTSPATAGRIDSDGYVYVMGRTDDVINVAGHRLSTGRWRRSWRATRPWPSAR